ncbi:unnamed protein product [Microthlaspi erraticum]|uniref:NYN domain-containing protein n=1 Tax=Microthlaspi erraticum TaxID=1685480 RepID=A0A6D2HPU0_9BRAS|nr:unnamed protein product [Microthlaspi erraticum]
MWDFRSLFRRSGLQSPNVLPALSATGVLLYHVHGFEKIFGEFLRWTRSNLVPANILLITGNELVEIHYQWFSTLQLQGFTILHANPQGYPQANEDSYLWESLLKVPTEESETSRCLSAGGEYCFKFFCSVCCDTCTGKSFRDFTKHLNSRAHVLCEFDKSHEQSSCPLIFLSSLTKKETLLRCLKMTEGASRG